MLVHILGTGAGGACPQWNCACHNCVSARAQSSRVRPHLHASVALSSNKEDWHLLNATPDVHPQVESFSGLHPGPAIRQTPLRSVLLSDAELDHTIGLLTLREGAPLDIYGTKPVLAALSDRFPVRTMLSTYAPLRWIEVNPSESFMLDGGALRITAFPVGDKRPRYAADRDSEGAWVIGYRFEDPRSKGVLVYAPSVEVWTRELELALSDADCALIDGTFWSDDEMQQTGTGSQTATSMGHIPISGPGGTLERAVACGARRRIYIHINNTNPVLDSTSLEFRKVIEAGFEVAQEGMEIEV